MSKIKVKSNHNLHSFANAREITNPFFYGSKYHHKLFETSINGDQRRGCLVPSPGSDGKALEFGRLKSLPGPTGFSFLEPSKPQTKG